MEERDGARREPHRGSAARRRLRAARSQLTSILANEAAGEGDRKPAATAALARLADGVMMTHVVTHLRSVDDTAAEQLQKVCHLVGPSIVKGLAEALANEKRAVARQRFTQILLGFGAAGKTAVEQLRASANPAVRRTAIHLLREFGGSEALPDLTTLLDDREPHVQREAVRAILSIGTEEAYAELQQRAGERHRIRRARRSPRRSSPCGASAPFLFSNTSSGRSIARARSAPSICKPSNRLARSKPNTPSICSRRRCTAVEWWAPFRTAELRRAVATALHQIGTAEAQRVLAGRRRRTRGHRAACAAADTGGADHDRRSDTRSAVRRSDPALRRVAARHSAVLAQPPDRRAQPRRARRGASRPARARCVGRHRHGRRRVDCRRAADDQGQRVDGRADSPVRRDGHRAHHDRAPR